MDVCVGEGMLMLYGMDGVDVDAEAVVRWGYVEALRVGDVDGVVKVLVMLVRWGEGDVWMMCVVVLKVMVKLFVKLYKGFMKLCVKTYRMDAALRYARFFDVCDCDFVCGKDLYCMVIYLCGCEEGLN